MNNINYKWIEIETKQLKHNEVEVDWIVYRKVYVSDINVEKALEHKDERILITILPWNKNHKYVTTWTGDESKFINLWNYVICTYEYIAEIPEQKEEVKTKVTLELTPEQLEQIKKQFNI